MRTNWRIKVFVFTAAMTITRLCVAAGFSGDWVGQITGPFDSQYTAQYSHVTLTADGAKLGGVWGAYKLAGTLAGTNVELSLTDASGKPAGTLTGTVSGDVFSGTGHVAATGRGGGTAPRSRQTP